MLSNTMNSNISSAPATQAASVSLHKLAEYPQRCWDRVTFRSRETLLSLASADTTEPWQTGKWGIAGIQGCPQSPVCSRSSLR